jgi:quinol monooxygenase YgiN
MPDTNQEIRVIAEFQAKPGQETALREVLHACVPPTRAEKENRGYTLHEDLDRPGRYFLYETWVSRDALKRHFQTPHFRTLDDRAKPLLSQPLSLAVVRALD